MQAVGAAVSSLHVNVAPASVEWNEIDALVVATVPLGAASIVVSGGVVSTVHERVAGVGSLLPAASVAVTVKGCAPAARPVSCLGDVHDVGAALSSWHVNVDPVSVEVKLNDAVDAFVSPVGPAVIDVSGGVVSVPHEPGVGPSIRDRPPLETFVTYGWPQAS